MKIDEFLEIARPELYRGCIVPLDKVCHYGKGRTRHYKIVDQLIDAFKLSPSEIEIYDLAECGNIVYVYQPDFSAESIALVAGDPEVMVEITDSPDFYQIRLRQLSYK